MTETTQAPTRERPIDVAGWQVWTEIDEARGEVYAFFRVVEEDGVEWISRRPCRVDAQGNADVTIHLPTYLAYAKRLKHGWIEMTILRFALARVTLRNRQGETIQMEERHA